MPDSHFYKGRCLTLVGATLLTYSVARANVTLDTDGFGNVDGRGSITERASILGLSEDEVARIRASTGYVICPASEAGNPLAISAVIVGSNMQIATAAHAFIDFDGVVRGPLVECWFQNQEPEPFKVLLDIAPNRYINGANPGVPREYHYPEEWAVVALLSPVTSATPFALGSGLSDDSTILVVSAHQKSSLRDFPPGEPVIQACRKRAQRGNRLFVDCDLTPLASGGPILSRSEAGELVFQGIVVSGGNSTMDYTYFSLSTGSYNAAIAPHTQFLDAIQSIAANVMGWSRGPQP